MDLLALEYDAPIFSRVAALEVVKADGIMLDSWIRQGVFEAEKKGRERRMSFEHLLTLDIIHLLIDGFRMRPSGAGEVAAIACSQYRPFFPNDAKDIAAGRPWSAPHQDRGDTQEEGFIRDTDGTLRRFRETDDPSASVAIIVPTRLIARRLLASLRDVEVAVD